MKNYKISPFTLIFVAFIILNILAGVMYRFSWWFENDTNWYLWLLSFFVATIILFWGLGLHFKHYPYNVKSNHHGKKVNGR
jgi:hypothetical protein